MKDKMSLVRRYFEMIERFETDMGKFSSVFHPEFIQIEFPNAIAKNGQERGIDGCREGLEKGKKILSHQKMDVTGHFESGSYLNVEAKWSGTMALDIGPFKKGQVMKAHLCMVFEFKDGRIFRQRNYDCYEPL